MIAVDLPPNNRINRSRASGFRMIPSALPARPGYAGR